MASNAQSTIRSRPDPSRQRQSNRRQVPPFTLQRQSSPPRFRNTISEKASKSTRPRRDRAFKSGYRFSDAPSSSKSNAPLGLGHRDARRNLLRSAAVCILRNE